MTVEADNNTKMCASDDAIVETSKDATAKEGAVKEDEKKADDTGAEPKKKPIIDWPVRNIKEPHNNDVLYGRGGGTNHHPGNKRYRKKVEDRKVDYVNCKRLDKPLVALEIIREWRGQDPPGRFLKMDDKTGLWNDVGDKKAREKTSQALREKAPVIRMELEKERRAKERADRGEPSSDEEEDVEKSTRFADGTSMNDGPRKPGIVARDHSLGVEVLNPEEEIGLEGFSWQEPVHSTGVMSRIGSQGSSYGPPPMMPPYGHGHAGARMGSLGSFPPPPPPPGAYEHVSSGGDRNMRFASWGRYESWGSMPGGMQTPPPPMGYGYPPPHTQSGGWTAREHSLGQNPLTYATVSQAAYPTAFDHSGRNLSGQWGPPQPPYPPMEGPPPYPMSSGPHALPPPPGAYPPAPPPEARREYSNSGQLPVAPVSPTSYTVDPAVASQWSGQDPREIEKTLSAGSSVEDKDSFKSTPTSSPTRKASTVPKPDIVKRMTSNQNETSETKPDLHGQSVKRCNLNREGSIASNRLKEKYMPGYFDSKREVEILSTNLKQSTLNAETPKPAHMSERMTTLDMNALDLIVKPAALNGAGRSTTIDALNIDFDDDPQMDRSNLSTMDDIFSDEKESALPRPPTLSMEGRITTTDLIDIVNEPITEEL